jgi:nitrite reductase/ring-hydroxylating ferredoxin subunit/Fe-S cluster biogenesis protein NfuA
LTVQALKSAIEDLHKEALKRLIRALKDDPAAGVRLREALADPVVYAVLRFHGLIRAPLAERVNLALEEVRPALAGHGGGVELVAIKPPDTVDLRLIGSCHGCPASGQTLSEGVEKAIRAHCPEILHINQVSRAAPEARSDVSSIVHFISPFALHAKAGWLDAGTLAEIREDGVTERKLKGRSVLLAKHGEQVSCFDNSCAHLGMPLEMGEVNDGVITCSYHGFKYLLETGECLTAPEVQLKVHAVRVAGNHVQVRLEE